MTDRRKEPPRRVDQPEPGYFRTRLVRKGPYVAARIIYDPPMWSAEIDGKPCGLPDPDPARADGVFAVWTFGTVVTRAEYDALLARTHGAPSDRPVNVNKLAPMW